MDDADEIEFGDDLYGDLDSSAVAAAPPTTTTSATSTKTKATSSSTPHPELDVLNPAGSIAYTTLVEENEALKRNMSTLWRTAKAEMRRREGEIDCLKVRAGWRVCV